MDEIIYLIAKRFESDQIGNQIPVETKTEVFAKKESTYGEEFYAAGQAGIAAKYKFIVNRADYNGEAEVEYNGERYPVYRTYEKKRSEEIELHCSERVGA